MGEKEPTIKWGDIIRIHGVNLSKKDEENTKGLIISKGFTDPNVYYQKYKEFQDVNMYRESLFQICPRISFDVHDQLEDAPANIREQNKGRVLNQIDNFQKVLQARAGTQVKYGSQVIFKHVKSQSYLRGILKAADIGEGAFTIDVTQSMSSKIIFKITSHRSYEDENDEIYYDDALLIYHPNADCYMNFAQKDEPIYLDTDYQLEQIPKGHHFSQFSKQRPSIKRPKLTRIPIINENKWKCYWKFIQHCTYEEQISKQKIKSHDIVYFQHTKQSGLVSSTLAKNENGQMEYYLKESESGNFYYECFWQLIPKQVEELGPEKCNFFWVRNVVTGQLLNYEGFRVEIVKQGGQGDTLGFDDEGLINLVCSAPDQNDMTLKLERGQNFPQDQDKPKIVSFFQSSFSKLNFKTVYKMPKDIFKIHKVNDKTLLDVQFILSSHQPLVKIIQIISSSLMHQDDPQFIFEELVKKQTLKEDHLNNIIIILKMLIGKIYHTNYEDSLTSGSLPDSNIQKLMVEAGIVQLVIQLTYLIYKPFRQYEDGDSKQLQSDQCLRFRMRLADIFQFSYRLLERTASYNEQNRAYISRWVDLFLLHSNTINRPYIQECLVGILNNNSVSIQATINRDKINQQITSFFTEAKNQSTDTFLTTKYLKLFSTFIVCQDRVIRENQNIILNDFFKNIENQLSFKFKVESKPQYEQSDSRGNDDFINKIRGKQIHLAFGKQEFTNIRKFFRDWTSKWNYFMAYVNLLADICMQRNSEAIENVSVLLSLQIVTTILFDPELEELNNEIAQQNRKNMIEKGQLRFPIANIHQPFIRIAHHLYIDNDRFNPVKRIKRISRWYAHEGEQGPIIENINTTKRVFQGEKEEEQLKYLKCILIFLKRYLQRCDQNSNNLSMLYTVLNVLKTTVTLGLWTKSEQFRQIIPFLMMRIIKIDKQNFFEADAETKNRLTPDEILKMKKSLLTFNRPQITKSIECKTKSTEIFLQMNEYQIDIRLRYLMNFFKGLYQTTEDFNVYDFMDTPQQHDEEKLSEEEKRIQQRGKIARQVYNAVKQNKILGGDVKKVSEDQEIILKQNVWYNKLKQMTPFTFNKQSAKDPMKNRYQFQGGVLKDIAKLKDPQEITAFVDKNFKYLVMTLMQLPTYQNQRLLDFMLRTLRTIFEQRTDLITNFKKILICGKGNLQQVYLTLKFMRGKFEILNDQNIVKYQNNQDSHFSFAFWKEYDYLQKAKERRSGIIQDLWFLSKTLIENISLKNIQSLMSVDNKVFEPNSLYISIDERQKTNSLFQSVNLAEGIYKPLISYIKIMGQVDGKYPQIHYRLLGSIFQYLSLLCFNNLQAKQILMPQIPYILPFLSKRVGAAQLLHIVARNNKLLVSNEDLVSLIIEESLKACIKLDQDAVLAGVLQKVSNSRQDSNFQFEKSCIFYALRGILVFNDEGHRKNQQLLMDRLQDIKYRGLIIKNRIIDYKITKFIHFDLSPPQTQVTAHFQMFTSLVESGNFINIGKLQNIHSYPYLLECMKSTTKWQIRRVLRSYVNRLYYVNKDKDIFMFEEFIRKQFDIINQQISDLVSLHKGKLLKTDLRIKMGIRFKFAISEIMLFIIQILISLHQILLKSEFMKVLRRELAKQEKYADTNRILHEKIIRLYKNLGCLNKLYPETKIICAFLRQVSILVNKTLFTFQVKYLEKKSQPDNEAEKQQPDEIGGEIEKKSYVYDQSKTFFRNLNDMIRDLKAKEKLQRLRQQFYENKGLGDYSEDDMKRKFLQTIYSVPSQKLKPVHRKDQQKTQISQNPHLQTTTSRTFKVLAKPQISDNQQNLRLNDRLSSVKFMMDQSPIFNKFKDDEFIKLVSIISQLDGTSSQYYEEGWQEYNQPPKPVISLKQSLTTIFSMVIQNPYSLKDNQKIFIIKIVRCYITESIEEKQDYKLSVDKWSPDYHNGKGEEDQRLKARQELLEECRCSEFIISVLSENLNNRLQLFNQTLLLGIAYLFGGNKICQNSIMDVLKGDKENSMLLNLRKIFKKIGQFLIQIRAIKQSDKLRAYAINIVDTYDYFSVKDHAIVKEFGLPTLDKFEIQTEQANENAISRLFRLLQLFCQNNNINFKTFLETQTNLDGSRKSNSVNFIEEASLLLSKFFKIMNNKVVSIPNYLLAFIGEITQLPCLNNQISFMKSTFFEDISYLAVFFNEQKNKEQRKFNQFPEEPDDPLYQLMSIYQQGVSLALSNFEGNNSILYSQFLNKCQPKFLWIVIRQNIQALLKEDRFNDWEIVSKNQNTAERLQQNLQILDMDNIQKLINLQIQYKPEFQGPLVTILNVITILRKLNDYSDNKRIQGNQNKVDPDQQALQQSKKATVFKEQLIIIGSEEYPHLKDFIQICQKLLLQIEVASFNGKEVTHQNVYFPDHPVFAYLSPATRGNIMMEVERKTRRDKLLSMTAYYKTVVAELKWGYVLNKNVFKVMSWEKRMPITSDLCQQVRKWARNLSFLIIFLLVVFIAVDHDLEDQMTSQFTFTGLFTQVLIKILCFIQLGLSLFYCYLWGKMRSSLSLIKYYDQQKQQQQVDNINDYEQAQEERQKQGWMTITYYLSIIWTFIHRGFSKLKSLFQNNGIYRNLIEPIIAIAHAESGFLSLALFLVTSFLGTFYGVEYFTIHLFDIFTTIPLLTNVFKAVINNIKTLTILSMLATAFVLVFNILSLSTYTPVIYGNDIPEQACEDILDCVLVVYTSGAIGDDMDELVIGRFIFDTVFVVFMEMLFSNLISGVMLDAFGKLKAQDSARDQDKEGMCYICGMTVENIEKTGGTFFKHKQKHFLWHYLFYIYCLNCKDQTDYTGIQYTIITQLDHEEVDWFPDLGQNSDEGEVEKKLEALKAIVEGVKDRTQKAFEQSSQTIEEGQKSIAKPAFVNEE